MTTASDPLALLRTRSYVGLLVLAGIIGVPISAGAWGFLDLVNVLQSLIFTDLPHALGFKAEPIWWPLPLLALSGVGRLMSDSSSVSGWLTFGAGAVWAVIMLVVWLRSRGGSA